MRRHVAFIFILKRMLNGSPEIHCHRTDLNFHLKSLGAVDRLYYIVKDHVITPITALFNMSQIVLLTFYFHICSSSDDCSDCINIFFKLTDDPDTCKVFHLGFHLFNRNMFALHFLQNTGYTFYSSTDLFNG